MRTTDVTANTISNQAEWIEHKTWQSVSRCGVSNKVNTLSATLTETIHAEIYRMV
jgi:hypothetical protein